jgi:hypothetical protein
MSQKDWKALANWGKAIHEQKVESTGLLSEILMRLDEYDQMEIQRRLRHLESQQSVRYVETPQSGLTSIESNNANPEVTIKPSERTASSSALTSSVNRPGQPWEGAEDPIALAHRSRTPEPTSSTPSTAPGIGRSVSGGEAEETEILWWAKEFPGSTASREYRRGFYHGNRYRDFKDESPDPSAVSSGSEE